MKRFINIFSDKDKERQEQKAIVVNTMNEFKNHSTDNIKKLIEDIMELLQVDKDNFKNFEQKKFFKRIWGTFSKKNKKLNDVNVKNLIKIQKLSLSLISEMEKKNMFTKEVQVMMVKKIKQISKNQIEFKCFLDQIVSRITGGFEKIQESTDFNLLLHKISYGVYTDSIESLLSVFTSLKIEKDFDDKISLLICALEKENIINDKVYPLKLYIEEAAEIEKREALNILKELSCYVEDPICIAIAKILREYSGKDEKVKKFIKLENIIDEIGAILDIEEKISPRDLFNCFIKNKKNYVEAEWSNVEQFNYMDRLEDTLNEDSSYEKSITIKKPDIINFKSQDKKNNESNIAIRVLDVLDIDIGIKVFFGEEKTIKDKNIKMKSPIEIDGDLCFENCDIEFSNKIINNGNLIFNNCKIYFNHKNMKNHILGQGNLIYFNNCYITSSEVNIDDLNEKQKFMAIIEFNKDNGNIQIKDCIIKNVFNFINGAKNLKIFNSTFKETKGFISIEIKNKLNLDNIIINNHRGIKITKEVYADKEYNYTICCDKEIIVKDSSFKKINMTVLKAKKFDMINSNFFKCRSYKYFIENLDGKKRYSTEENIINGCNFEDCSNLYITGGMIINCIFKEMKSNNMSTSLCKGGAIYMECNEGQILNCKFINCRAKKASAIYLQTNKIKRFNIKNCIFENCISQQEGVIKIYVYKGKSMEINSKIEKCTFINSKDTNGRHIDNINCYEKGVIKKISEFYEAANIIDCDFK